MKKIVVSCAMVLIAGIALGSTNPVPYAEDFEGYTNGQVIAVDGTDGWYADDGDALMAVDTNYSGDFYLPLPDSDHTRVLELKSNATNLVESSTSTPEVVWVDTVLKPTVYDTSDTGPAIPADAQVALYVNTNNHVMLWHRMMVLSPGDRTNRWTEITDATIESGAWARVSMRMDYTHNLLGGGRYFELYVDGVAVTSDVAVVGVDEDTPQTIPASLTYGGTWFGQADYSKTHISSLGLNGTGFFDDLVVTNAKPANLTEYVPNSYTVTATVVTGDGTIAPSGAVVVVQGNDQAFTMSPAAGSAIDSVSVNGGDAGSVSYYEFTDVQSNQTIMVTFAGTVYGIPVSWAEAAGITNDHKAAMLLDQDGDGFSTSNEWRASTDPLNSNSFFQVSDAASGSFTLTWYSENIDGGLGDFVVERTEDLINGPWTNIPPTQPRAETNEWTDTTPPETKAFYRVIAP